MNGAAFAAPFAHPPESHAKERPAEAELETIATEARAFDACACGGWIACTSDTPETASAARLSIFDRRTSQVCARKAAPAAVGPAAARGNRPGKRRREAGRFRFKAPEFVGA